MIFRLLRAPSRYYAKRWLPVKQQNAAADSRRAGRGEVRREGDLHLREVRRGHAPGGGLRRLLRELPRDVRARGREIECGACKSEGRQNTFARQELPKTFLYAPRTTYKTLIC